VKRFRQDRVQGLGTPARSARRQPTPHELRVFIALWEERHFGRASTRLGIAQSSFSETLRRLEAKLDTVLFERTSRRVWPTDAGGDLVNHARRVLDELDRAADTRPQPSDDREVIRIGIEGQGFGDLNGPIVAEIQRRFPHAPISVREVTGDPRSFFDEQIDVALMITPMVDERFRVRCMALEERGILAPAHHPAAGMTGLTLEDVLDEPFVELVPHIDSTRAYWLAADRRGGDSANVGGWACTTHDAVYAIAFDGLLSTGCASAVRAFPNAPMVFIPVPDLPPGRWDVMTRADDRRPRTAALVDAIGFVVRAGVGSIPGVWLPDDPGARAGALEPVGV